MGALDSVMTNIISMEIGYDAAFLEALRESDKEEKFAEKIDILEKSMKESHQETSFWGHKKLRDAINKGSKGLCKEMGLEMGDLSKDPKRIQRELMGKK